MAIRRSCSSKPPPLLRTPHPTPFLNRVLRSQVQRDFAVADKADWRFRFLHLCEAGCPNR